jgi:uncharacterized DUF497 family protein
VKRRGGFLLRAWLAQRAVADSPSLDARSAIIPPTPYDEGETIRMISARLVTKQERRIYEEGES